jgi:hypothetical protein
VLPHVARAALVLACLAALGLAAAVPAQANGDPPSDVLLVTDVYRPYVPPVRPAVLRALSSTVAEARRHGRPVKVALIASVIDLGNVPNLWAQPRKYARFLAQELRLPVAHGSRGRANALAGHAVLIVVMPQGIGIEGGISQAAALRAAAGVHVRAGQGADVGASSKAFDSNALARAGMDAVVRVARLQGIHLSAPRIPLPATSDDGRSWLIPVVVAAVICAAAAGTVLAVALPRRS